MTGLAVTKLDVLSGLDKLQLASHYQVEGKRFDRMPENIRQAAQAQPVYESMPGWKEDIAAVRSYADLPVKTRDYLKRLEDLSGAAPVIVSVGPEREATMLLRNPFEKA